MPSTITPVFTDNVAVIAVSDLAINTVARGTIDLRSKYGAWLFPRIGRGGTTAIGTSIKFIARRMINNTSAKHPTLADRISSTAAANSTTINADAALAATAIVVASATGLAADDVLLIGNGTAREEWVRVARVNGTTLTLDAPLLFAHTAAQADTVRNKSDIFTPIWLPGGAQYEVIFDYGASATGNTARVECLAQTHDSMSVD